MSKNAENKKILILDKDCTNKRSKFFVEAKIHLLLECLDLLFLHTQAEVEWFNEYQN